MKTTVVICKGDPDIEGWGVKINMLNVLLRLVRMSVPKSELLSDKACYLLNLPNDKEGDPQWVEDNVLRKVYWDSTSNDREAEERAEVLFKVYKQAGGTNQIGLGIIKKYLQSMYLIERCASIFVR